MSDREFGRTVADAIRFTQLAECVFLEVKTGPADHECFDFWISCQQFVEGVGRRPPTAALPSRLDTYKGRTWLVVGAHDAIAHAEGRVA